MFDFPIDTKVLAFDVYGTLVDWNRGLAEALARETGIEGLPAIGLLEARIPIEQELEAELEEFRPYREILAESLVRAAEETGLSLGPAAAERIAGSIAEWPLFPDVAEALPRLARRYRLAAVSNVDREDLARTLARMPAPFEHAVPADHVGCYKPEPDHFLALMHEMVVDEHEVLAVSAFPEYDLEIATDLGIPAAYVDRRGRPLPEDVEVLHRVRDLRELADRLLRPRGRGGRRGRVARRPRRR